MPEKSVPKKKTAAGKTSKKTGEKNKQAVKLSPGKKKLIDRLDSLLEGLGENDLKFLISQAEVLDYNRREEERAAAGLQVNINPADFEIKKPDRKKVEIIEGDGSSHFIIAGAGVRKFFDIQEMRKLVKLCHGAPDRKEAQARLYGWLGTNRKDYINDAEISGPSDSLLGAIYEKIIKTYKVKE